MALAGICAIPALVAQLTFTANGQAQTPPREVLLGVSKVGRPAAPASTSEQEAAQIYQAASSLLRAGDMAAAQRQLEQLVARYPDTDGAARARIDLAAIYNSASSSRQQAALPGANQISHLGRAEAEVPSANSAWRTSVKPSTGFQKTIQEDFRAAAGDLVFFSEGSAELGARARKALAQQAEWLNRHPERSAIVEGHADEAGNGADLKALSAARAEAVRARLVEDGVAPQRIRVVAHGAERPVALCEDQSCASQNRRVATIIAPANTAQLPVK